MDFQDTGWDEELVVKEEKEDELDVLQAYSDLEQGESGSSSQQGTMPAIQSEDSFGKELSLYDQDDGSCSSHSDKMASANNGGRKTSETLQQLYFSSVKEGMATCEHCGNVGIKHAFYSKSKRFCSMACSKAYSSAQKKVVNARKNKVTPPKTKAVTTPPPMKTVSKKFDWGDYMNDNKLAAPVHCFRHAALSDMWDNITVGMKVEVPNRDCDLPTPVYWIAAVIRIAGYRVLLRYEGFGGDPSLDFWLNLGKGNVHPVGWCATNRKPLVPPKTIENKYDDWKEFLVKRLTGARTLPNNFYSQVQEALHDTPLKPGMMVEVVDKTCVSAMRVAKIDEIIGSRLKLQYTDSHIEQDQFWCHMRSSLVHPVGWSQMVGHKLRASPEYRTSSLNKAVLQKFTNMDSTPDMFLKPEDPPGDGLHFQAGMKIEAIDPLNLSTICVATVMKVLRNNYLMIGIDGSMAENGADWFCYHASSPCIFPVGFCEINGLPLTPPRGYKGSFKWLDYLKQTKSVAAPVRLFREEIPKHGFKIGMKLEAVDLMEPRLICVATVNKVVGRLLRVHFDGWEQSYDQWVDCQSPDIYPVGWCEMVNHSLEGPRMEVLEPVTTVAPKKRPVKPKMYRGPRKKKRVKSSLERDKEGGDSTQEYTEEGDWESSQDVPIPSDVMGTFTNHLDQSSSSATTANITAITSKPTSSISAKYSTIQSALQSSLKTPTWSFSAQGLDGGIGTIIKTEVTDLPPGGKDDVLPPSVFNIPQVLPPGGDTDADPGHVHVKYEAQPVCPELWEVADVCQFLTVNGCAAFCDSFSRKGINGARLMALSKEQIASLMGMKVGPSLRIHNLIQALKKVANQQLEKQSALSENS